MNGESAVVKEVGGAADKFEVVNKPETSLLALEVDGEHSSRGVAKLLAGDVVERVVGQSGVSHLLNLRNVLDGLCHSESVARLHTIARVESLQTDCLHICHMGRHIGTEVHEHLLAHTLTEVGHSAIVDYYSTYCRGTTRDILGARHHLDIHSQCLGAELREWNHCRVGNERDVMPMSHIGESLDVGNLHLRIGYYLHEDAACGVVDGFFYSLNVGEVA